MPVPFAGELFTFPNPDGSEITVRGWGNQYHAAFETVDGFTVTPDPETGFLEYARRSADAHRLDPTGIRVGAASPSTAGLRPHARVTPAAAAALATVAWRETGGSSRWELRRARVGAAVRRAAARGAPGPTSRLGGDYLGLCLLVEFPDLPATIPQPEVDRFCNEPGYSGFGNNGSVHDYFRDNSNGRFNYRNLVTGYYRAGHPRRYYTDPSVPFGIRARELIVEALDHLAGQGFDFTVLSSDDEDFVYALNVYYAGRRRNGWQQGLWPHSAALAEPYVTRSGKKLLDYQIADAGESLTLRTFCHETGHLVCDFPDLYDYGGESYGVGQYCLMGYGGADTNPTQISAYLKREAGWAAKVTTLRSGMTVRAPATGDEFFLFPRNTTEYFLLENRQRSGRDAALPDCGLAIWHVDALGSNANEQMTPELHYLCSLEQADGRFDLERRENSGATGDLYPGQRGSDFTGDTVPSSRWWDGSESGLAITNISARESVVTFTVGHQRRGCLPVAEFAGLFRRLGPARVLGVAIILIGWLVALAVNR